MNLYQGRVLEYKSEVIRVTASVIRITTNWLGESDVAKHIP